VPKEIVNMQEPLVQLADRIPWKDLENDLSKFYFHTGTPSMPIRLMAGLLILKSLYNFGDESIVDQWIQNPYYQHEENNTDHNALIISMYGSFCANGKY
jgi:IS5 family transposase